MEIRVKTRTGEYPIYLERGGLARAGEQFSLNRKCFILTDENIPSEYVETLKRACREPHVFVIEPGERSKTLAVFEACIMEMLNASFSRTDCVIALGGGVVGDLAGFVASAYLRGVDFYNIPTTLLSQVDSSIGGKVAVNVKGLKNMVGAFYPPKAVLIDPNTLSSLPRRHLAAGLAESVKMAMTFDQDAFRLIEENDPMEHLDKIIEQSLRIKKQVVEEDELESDLRKVLNFGHTLAHAIESESHKTDDPLFHGESVALGMIPMCSPEARARLVPVLEKIGLPTRFSLDPDALLAAMRHDKKVSQDSIVLIRVDEVGSYRMETKPLCEFEEEVKGWKL